MNNLLILLGWFVSAQKPEITPDFMLTFSLPGAPEIDSFVGRHPELQQIESALGTVGQSRKIVVLQGLGGMGKTQLSIQYAKGHQQDYSAILWLNGQDEATLQQSFGVAAKRLAAQYPSSAKWRQAIGSTDTSQAMEALQLWLDNPENTRWLLIFDNVDDPLIPGVRDGAYNIQSYFPKHHGHILVTTRSAQLRIGKTLAIKPVNESECLEILVNRSGREDIRQGTRPP